MIDKTEDVLIRAQEGEYKVVENLLYDSDEHKSTDLLIRKVIDSGRRVYVPEEDELFLDLDSQKSLSKFWTAKLLFETVQAVDLSVTYYESKTAYHNHVVLKCAMFANWPLTKKIYYQALLGSDPVKEMLSKIRLDNGVTYSILLFNVPGLARN